MSNPAGYVWGQCAWFLQSIVGWLPASLGDAWQWADNAKKNGLTVSPAPVIGSVAVWGKGNESATAPAGVDGHVAEVVGFQSNGLPIVREMNWNGGVGKEDTRNLPNLDGIVGFIYPPGTGALGSQGGAGAAPGVSAAAGINPTPATSDNVGATLGGQAAAHVFNGAKSLFGWASNRSVALVAALILVYFLFAPELHGGPSVRV